MFHGPPTLSVVSLVSCAMARSPLSLAISSVRSCWVTVNVAPERHGSGCGSQRYLPLSSGAALAAPIEIRPAASTTMPAVGKTCMAFLPLRDRASSMGQMALTAVAWIGAMPRAAQRAPPTRRVLPLLLRLPIEQPQRLHDVVKADRMAC